MKPKHRYDLFLQQLREAREYHFLWIWRLLFTWGWNGEKDTFSIAFYQPDLETQIWSIGDY